jgi:hypothetical protein
MFEISSGPEQLLLMILLLEVTFEKGLGGHNWNWNIQTSGWFPFLNFGFAKYFLHPIPGSVLPPAARETWIIHLWDVVAFDGVLLSATFLHCGRRATHFVNR